MTEQTHFNKNTEDPDDEGTDMTFACTVMWLGFIGSILFYGLAILFFWWVWHLALSHFTI